MPDDQAVWIESTSPINAMDEPASKDVPITKRKGPRLYHKKSRYGCDRCKARRVKCDEVSPTCSNCHRHGVSCMYESRAKLASDQGGGSQQLPQPTALTPSSVGTPDDFRGASSHRSVNVKNEPQLSSVGLGSIPESSSRRLLELRLLHHFLTNTMYTFPGAHSEVIRQCWTFGIPKMALGHQPLLYELLSLSAMHLLKSGSNEPELLIARRDYLHQALVEHRLSVPQLSVETADAVGFTCVILVVDAFAQLQERPIEPYTPPTQWLNLARGAFEVLNEAQVWINGNPDTMTTKIADDDPISCKYLETFGEENRRGFSDLLNQNIPIKQEPQMPWDTETRQAYELTLSYIGATQKAIKAGEHQLGICRRITTFAVLIPGRFAELIEQQEPRALVVLAHCFALGAGIDVWWMGDTVRREISAIYEGLPDEWRPFMREPLAAIGSG